MNDQKQTDPIDLRDMWHQAVMAQAAAIEVELQRAIGACLVKHAGTTGWSPSSIRITMVETTELGSRRPEHILSRVTVSPPPPP